MRSHTVSAAVLAALVLAVAAVGQSTVQALLEGSAPRTGGSGPAPSTRFRNRPALCRTSRCVPLCWRRSMPRTS